MSQTALLETAPANHSPGEFSSSGPLPAEHDLVRTLAEVEAIVPPLWPLKDYVAVNPFVGLSEYKFLAARQLLREVRDCELLPGREFCHTLSHGGEFSREDLESALSQCAREYPDLYAHWDLQQLHQQLAAGTSPAATSERHYYTLSEIIDRQQQTTWTSHIVNDITRHCSAHYDEGQAFWPSPWKAMPLFEAWRETALVSRRMEYLGISGFSRFIRQLPAMPMPAIAWLLRELKIPPHHWRHFLLCQIFSIAGWASFIKYRVREAEGAGRRDEDLLGLLAIRLAYDAALEHAQVSLGRADREQLRREAISPGAEELTSLAPPAEVLTRYVLQVATETAYRRQLLRSLAAQRPNQASADRKTAQLIFCIDVRSEILRRHLEDQTDSLETFGFAGFFGMAIEYIPLGESRGVAQCPVLLRPNLRVPETVSGVGNTTREATVLARRGQRQLRSIWKSFQTSAVSCFSFVESLGLLYFGKLCADSLRLTKPVRSADREGASRHDLAVLGPDLRDTDHQELSVAQKTDLAEGMLRNLGLTEGFARIVVICGHAADVVNNPYKAGLDCGACGGHSGEPNARVAAALLNDRQVRRGLEARQIFIPGDTWFVPAVHHTTTDEVHLLDTATLPPSHGDELTQVEQWLQEAGARCRTERCRRLPGATAEDVFRRSRDWSEVRPEWGLAGNTALIVAPRTRTAGVELSGRTFMHSYDLRKDPELKVLELIMTAPMIVTSWINLQYFASTVDNLAFGSGNKAIHNVVGQLGVLQGNGGDLMTGMPWQSVHDGKRFQHEPLRLLILIEATRSAVQHVLAKHPQVRELIDNGWGTLVVLENHVFYRWTSPGTWEIDLAKPDTELAERAS